MSKLSTQLYYINLSDDYIESNTNCILYYSDHLPLAFSLFLLDFFLSSSPKFTLSKSNFFARPIYIRNLKYFLQTIVFLVLYYIIVFVYIFFLILLALRLMLRHVLHRLKHVTLHNKGRYVYH